MSEKRLFERIAFWGLVVPLVLGLSVWVFVGQRDEVAANSFTTGKIIDREKRIKSFTGGSCEFAYTVDGTRYEARDSCSASQSPIGKRVTVHYIADEPSVGFLGGDETWGGKLRVWGPWGAIAAGIVALGAFGGRMLRSSGAGGGTEP